MASAMIHICVAKKINEKLKRREDSIFLGTIAPDISRQINENKINSHFLMNSSKNNVPVIGDFIDKYKDDLANDFTLGYYIHLYTDKLWFEDFLPSLISSESIKLLDGTIIRSNEEEIQKIIYNDYSNINIALIDLYNLDLSLFYQEIEYPETKITEIPIDKLNIIVDKMGIIIKNSKDLSNYIFDINMIEQFIQNSADIIYKKIKELGIN